MLIQKGASYTKIAYLKGYASYFVRSVCMSRHLNSQNQFLKGPGLKLHEKDAA